MDGLRIDDWACSRSFIINFHYGVIPVRRWRTPKKQKGGVLSHFRKGRKTNLCCPIHIPLPYPSLPSLPLPPFKVAAAQTRQTGLALAPLSLSIVHSIHSVQYRTTLPTHCLGVSLSRWPDTAGEAWLRPE